CPADIRDKMRRHQLARPPTGVVLRPGCTRTSLRELYLRDVIGQQISRAVFKDGAPEHKMSCLSL
ncbi:MAG: hypothetical protein O3B08_18205, partial [Proteobacteria bacterium]|nr:hypothetical protein [Pseudomonadota bacterium]